MAEYFTIAAPCEAETRVKDSRFIAWLTPAQSREQAEDCIAERSKRFTGATHNCFALRIGTGNALLAYANDAHEPAGSAGRPMLQVLETHKLTNVAAVVTRYFGGTKLGIGGLVRAYGNALRAAVAAANLMPLLDTRKFRLVYQYSDSAVLEKALHQCGARVSSGTFGAEVQRLVEVPEEHAEEFQRLVQEASAGRVAAHAIAGEASLLS